MARPGAFKSEKRKKELMRQKKQEMKRQRRLGKDEPSGEVIAEAADVAAVETEEPKTEEEQG